MLDIHDHRTLGNQLDLFHLQEEAPGMVFWHPRGLIVYDALVAAVRRQMVRDGLMEVRTPQVMRSSIWEASGHWAHFRAGMLLVDGGGEPPSAALKPVSCPGHLELFRRMAPSYRDLPLRLGELGLVHRHEPSGTLHGLFRLRQCTQDDGHILCTMDQVRSEVLRFINSLRSFYEALGFGRLSAGFSTRPPIRAGSDELWDTSERVLLESAREAGLDCVLQPGEGAFYGPKIELALSPRPCPEGTVRGPSVGREAAGLSEHSGRTWQCGTIQLDPVLPERFGVEYVDSHGVRQRPVMLHRAMLGSLERFLGVLLEYHRGRLPAWLAPEQVIIAPVAERHREAAERARQVLVAAGLRVKVDARDESLGRRVALAHASGAPVLAVVGDREVASGGLTIRPPGDAEVAPRSMALAEAVVALGEQCRAPV